MSIDLNQTYWVVTAANDTTRPIAVSRSRPVFLKKTAIFRVQAESERHAECRYAYHGERWDGQHCHHDVIVDGQCERCGSRAADGWPQMGAEGYEVRIHGTTEHFRAYRTARRAYNRARRWTQPNCCWLTCVATGLELA